MPLTDTLWLAHGRFSIIPLILHVSLDMQTILIRYSYSDKNGLQLNDQNLVAGGLNLYIISGHSAINKGVL